MVDFRGREMAHLEFGEKMMNRLKEDLAAIAVVEIQLEDGREHANDGREPEPGNRKRN